MENIRYEFYSPNKGYEEIQANIFNRNTQRGVSAKDIERKITKTRKDPKLLRYAFSEEGKPLAYIQASQVSSSVYYLGYPWCIPECPSFVQEKLFIDMLEFLKAKDLDEIQYWLNASHKEGIAFFESKGFIQQIKGVTYKFNLQDIKDYPLESSKYTTHLATMEDVDLLVEIGTIDKELQQAGLTGEWLKNYFETKVLTDGHCIMVKDEDKIVCASAPLRDPHGTESNNIILRFTATRPGYEDVWPYLIVEIAKECIKAEWDLPLHVNLEDESKVANFLLPLKPQISESYHLYVLNLKR